MPIRITDILKVIPRYSKNVCEILFYKSISLFYPNKSDFFGAWLICERGTEAKDNSYVFFKYLRKNHPEINAYYLIDTTYTSDYEKIKPLGNVIQYNSFEHKMALFYATHFISTHIGYSMPWSYLLFKKIFGKKKYFIFLQHGITLSDMSNMFSKKTTGIDLIITATKDEYNSIAGNKKYGFSADEIALTGFARYDNLLDYTPKRQILFMPTWRQYLVTRNIADKNNPELNNDFLQSDYFKNTNSFLTNKQLIDLLVKNNLEFIFYPHFELQKSLSLFTQSNPAIKFAKKEEYDVQELLKESLLLITDYSSVFFDFAYMKKPLIYYQFDQEEYYKSHYQKGYFEIEKDGFGPVVQTEEMLLKAIEKVIESDFKMNTLYATQVDNTFLYRDDKNCERIFEKIKSLT